MRGGGSSSLEPTKVLYETSDIVKVRMLTSVSRIKLLRLNNVKIMHFQETAQAAGNPVADCNSRDFKLSRHVAYLLKFECRDVHIYDCPISGIDFDVQGPWV